jgi:hypothetical protein
LRTGLGIERRKQCAEIGFVNIAREFGKPRLVLCRNGFAHGGQKSAANQAVGIANSGRCCASEPAIVSLNSASVAQKRTAVQPFLVRSRREGNFGEKCRKPPASDCVRN